MSLRTTFILLLLSSLSGFTRSLVHASPQPKPEGPAIHPRNYVSATQLLDSYDYVIAGGGLAGLVLATGLSDADNGSGGKFKVLVIEAGPSGDDVRDKIDTPGATYYQSLLGAEPYDWLYKTVPQPNANNREIVQPRGKVLGGSSAVNGLYIVRPPKEQINAWHSLIPSSSSGPWTWDTFYKTMLSTETFSPPTDSAQTSSGSSVKYNADSRGKSGKLHVSYPGFIPPITDKWLPTLGALGVKSSEDAYGGDNSGAFIATSAINPANWTRSYSKSAWIDPLPPRENLHILTGAMVERVVFADNVKAGDLLASGVEFTLGKGQPKQTVAAGKEVILSGGAFGSPHILQLSGVGPRDVLEAANVPVKVELPGVGQHFTDHLAASVFFKTNDGVQTAGSIQQGAMGGDVAQSKEFLSFVNDAIAYVNGSRLFESSESYAGFRKGIEDAFDSSVGSLVPSGSSEVKEGYKAIYKTNLEQIIPNGGIVEMLFSINAPGEIAVQAALQNAFSRGRMYITSNDAYVPPNIDPNYFSHPADMTILRQGIKFARQIAATPPLSTILASETIPGSQVQSDQDLETYIRNSVGTEYHPGSTSAMLPREQGGVVDGNMKVYGTSNLRVVDAGVFTVGFSAHMMSVVYALAEGAVGVVLGEGKAANSTTGGSSGSNTTTGGGTDGSKDRSVAVGLAMSSKGWLGVVLAVALGAML